MGFLSYFFSIVRIRYKCAIIIRMQEAKIHDLEDMRIIEALKE